MPLLLRLLLVAALATLASGDALAAGAQTHGTPFEQLVDASHFVQDYQETAAVSARVFGARNKGSDKDYAAFMAKVAQADLADFRICIVSKYSTGPLTPDDATEIADLFRSPIGVKFLRLKQQGQIADIERGSHEQLNPALLTDTERAELAALFRRPAMQRYVAYMASPESATVVRTCLATSRVGREGGVKF